MGEGGTPVAALLHELCAGLAPARAEALRQAYDLVREAIPDGYDEVVAGRMIAWVVPLSRYPKTYKKQPLMAVALAATKGNNALHLTALYLDPKRSAAFQAAHAAAGVKLDMGKGCVRFTKTEQLVAPAIRDAVAFEVDDYLALYEAARA